MPVVGDSQRQLETVIVEQRGEVLVVTMNRPERLNAWNRTMSQELVDTIKGASDDPSVGAIVLTGNGRAFCAGADMQMLDERRALRSAGEPEEVGHGGMPPGVDWVPLIRSAPAIIAAINGVAVGVGLTMVLPFDVIMAADVARLGIGLTRVGLLPELGASHFLVQRMGFGRASEFCLAAEMWTGDQAAAAGLADHVVPAAELVDRAVELGAKIAAHPRPQQRLVKRLLTLNGSETDLDLIQTREDQLNRTYCVTSPEHREAVAAFKEKRPPPFEPRGPDPLPALG